MIQFDLNIFQFLIYLALGFCVFWLIWWITNQLPSPIQTIVKVIIGIIAIVYLINLLLPLMGQQSIVRL